MSVGQEFLIVATGCPKDSTSSWKDECLNSLQRSLSVGATRGAESEGGPWKFDVPDGDRSLMFGSFDNLIRLTDDLQKYDGQVDGIVHRLERQYLELDSKAQFQIYQRTAKSWTDFSKYIRNWQWDEGKYPKTRNIVELSTLLMQVLNKIDEEARNKLAQYNEYKTQKSSLAKKEGANLASRDLIDVLTPEVVRKKGDPDDDFIATEHLTTVVVIIPRGADAEFLQLYETMQENVVPMSARKFKNLDDKDGNSLWRVVMFKSAVEGFKKQCREKRFMVRDFEYSEEAYKKLAHQREQIEIALQQQHKLMQELYKAAWSDAMIAWVHVKALRVFVESVLRFGMPPRFASFIVLPKSGKTAAARSALESVLGRNGQSLGPYAGDKLGDAAPDEGDEYFPYVSFSFVPFNVPRG